MRKTTTIILTLILVSALSLTSAFAESHNFKTQAVIKIGDVNLEPGLYELRVNSTKTTAEIYKRGRLVARSKVSVSRLQGGTRHALLTNSKGEVREYRSGYEKMVFVSDDSNKTLASAEKQ